MLKADWPFGYDMAAARVLMLVTVANVAWRGTCMQAHAQSPDPHPIIRSGGTVTVVAPLQQPIVLQSMMNSSVSNLVYKVPHFQLVPAAWTYINRDTPFVLSRDFVISSEVQPPTVADFAMITNKLVLDNATLTFRNLVLTNSREIDPFGIDWVLNSAGSVVVLQNVVFVDELCATSPADTLQAARSLPTLPGYPPKQVSILADGYCLPQFSGVPPDNPAASDRTCVDQAVHFTSLHLMSNSATGGRTSGHLIVLQNVTSVCLAFVNSDCLRQHNKSYCWKLQAAELTGLQQYFRTADSSNSQGSRRLSPGAVAGIVIASVAATVIVAAALAFFGRLPCRQTHPKDAILVASSTTGVTYDSSADHWFRPKDVPALGGSNCHEIVIDNSPAGFVHATDRCLDLSSSISSKDDKGQFTVAGANRSSSAKQHKDITLGVLLGAGSFGRVYKGRWQGNEVAIKVIHCRPREVNRVLREAEILMSVQHPNIVRCFKCSVVRPHRRMKGVADGMEPADSALLQEPGPGPHQGSNNSTRVGSGNHPSSTAAGTTVSVPSQVPSDSSRQGAGTPPVASTSDAVAAGPAVGSGEGGVAGGQHWINLQEVGSTDSFDEELEQTAGGQPEVQVWLVLELCGGGNLQDSNAKPKTRFDMARLVCRLEEVAQGMDYLHSRGIMHSDLKAANVLLTNTIYGSYGQTAKLSDFGMANMLMDGATHRSTERMGTITHQAPEVLERGHLSPAADVYSFGIMMWELFTGTTAFKSLHYGAVVQRVVVKGQRPAVPPDAPAEYCLLMTRCWDASPHLRPTFKQIAECLRIMLEDQDSGALDLQNQVLVAQQPSVSLNSLDPAWKEPGPGTIAARDAMGTFGHVGQRACMPQAHATPQHSSTFSKPSAPHLGAPYEVEKTPASLGAAATSCHSSFVSDGGLLSGSGTVSWGTSSVVAAPAGLQNGVPAGLGLPAGSGPLSAGPGSPAVGLSAGGGTSAAQQPGLHHHSGDRPPSRLAHLKQMMHSSHVQDL